MKKIIVYSIPALIVIGILWYFIGPLPRFMARTKVQRIDYTVMEFLFGPSGVI